jgi:hypothetical protein
MAVLHPTDGPDAEPTARLADGEGVPARVMLVLRP